MAWQERMSQKFPNEQVSPLPLHVGGLQANFSELPHDNLCPVEHATLQLRFRKKLKGMT